MTEEEAREWVRDRYGVSRETILDRFAGFVVTANGAQNLIAASTIPDIWVRHLTDSAQLVERAADVPGLWIDIGSGAGFPGVVAALLRDDPVVLVEPRRKRADFLRDVAAALRVKNVEVIQRMAEKVSLPRPAAVVSARAVASLDALFTVGSGLAGSDTLWLLPKGMNATSELEAARQHWQGTFHVEPSITHQESSIVVARKVQPR